MIPSLPRLAAYSFVLVLLGCGPSEPGVARGEAIYDTCSPCHGEAGEGKEELEAPPLAGAAEWYLAAQLEKFHNGYRAYHYQDLGGLRMKPMRRALTSDEDVQSVLAYIATLPRVNPAPTGVGFAASGANTYPVCSACHGPQGAGVQELNAPSLLHLPDWYVALSVRKYRDRLRGAAEGDATGITMYPLVMNLTDDEIDDVAAFVQTLGDDGVPLGDARPGDTPDVMTGTDIEVDPATLPEGATVEMVQEGAQIFAGAGICYTCHMQEGVGGPLAPDLTDQEWLNVDGTYQAIIDLINAGVAQPQEYPGAMLPRAGMPLTDDQVAAVAAYVYTLSR